MSVWSLWPDVVVPRVKARREVQVVFGERASEQYGSVLFHKDKVDRCWCGGDDSRGVDVLKDPEEDDPGVMWKTFASSIRVWNCFTGAGRLVEVTSVVMEHAIRRSGCRGSGRRS